MMGVPIAIMMSVPIPEKKGEIECLRYVECQVEFILMVKSLVPLSLQHPRQQAWCARKFDLVPPGPFRL